MCVFFICVSVALTVLVSVFGLLCVLYTVCVCMLQVLSVSVSVLVCLCCIYVSVLTLCECVCVSCTSIFVRSSKSGKLGHFEK